MSPHLPQPTFVNPLNFVFLRNAGGNRSTARPPTCFPRGRTGPPAGPAVTRDGLQRPAAKERLPPGGGLLRMSTLSHSPASLRSRGSSEPAPSATAPLSGRLRCAAKQAPQPPLRGHSGDSKWRPAAAPRSPPRRRSLPRRAVLSPPRRAGAATREEPEPRGLEHRRRSPVPVPQPGVRRRRHGRPRTAPRGRPARGGCSASAALNLALLRGDRRAATWTARRSRRPPPSPAAAAVGRVGHGPA